MKLIGAFSFAFLLSLSTQACDVCGCMPGGFSDGLMPDWSNHYIGLRWNFSGYRIMMNHGSSGGSEYSDDRYNRLELIGRYKVNKRIRISASVPYAFNSMNGSMESSKVSGLSDPFFVASYQLLSDKLIAKNHFFALGAGLKFPLGGYEKTYQGELLHANFQPGTGSFDYLLTGNYFHRFKGISALSLDFYSRLTTQNKFDYRFGNQYGAILNYGLMIDRKESRLLFTAGFAFDYMAHHTHESSIVLNTGGMVQQVSLGLQYYRKKFRINLNSQLPVWQNYSSDNLTSIEKTPTLVADFIFFLGVKN